MSLFGKFFHGKQGEAPMKERRLWPRVTHKQTANLFIEVGRSVPVTIQNISLIGVSFISKHFLNIGSNYALKIKFSDKELAFGLEIIWKQKDASGILTYGAKFVGPGGQESPIFKQFLSSHK